MGCGTTVAEISMKYICSAIFIMLNLFLWTASANAREHLVVADAPTLLTGLVGIAARKGYFTEEGLDVEVKTYSTGDDATKAMFSGAADVATVAETAFVFDSFREKDFSLFATIGSWDNEVKIVARTDRGIRSLSDLRGKRVGTHPRISVHYFLYKALLKHDMTMSDIKPVFRKAVELPAMLESGEIDAISLREPFIGEAARRLDGKVLVFEEPGLYWKSFSLAARNETLVKRKAALVSLLRALHKAEGLVRQQPNEAATLIAEYLGSDAGKVAADLGQVRLRLGLEQRLLYTLENVASWAIGEGLVTADAIPNMLNVIHSDVMRSVKPNAVTVVR
jgi:ABC-type nitrate/sulfonate/bicarbonate transport system substrate-binding protein